MNIKMTTYILGKMLGVEAAVLIIPAFVGSLYDEDISTFLITSVILTVFFMIFGIKKPKNTTIYGKEGFVIIALAWVLWSVFGALPFYLSGAIPSYIDAVFETISGFTTTGSTILTDIAGMEKGMNFWRCLTHWIGGMGVLVFVMVIVSLEEKNSMHLMRAEVPGPETDKLVPKARSSAKILYGMYFALTFAEVILLKLGGMNWYDSIIHSFSTAGTGGFSNQNESIAYYDSAYIDGVITTFMILFGINFNMYYFLLLKKAKAVFKNEEVRVYLGIVATATIVITANIIHIYGSVFKAFRYAVFQVAAIITTTGFATANFDIWPELSRFILCALMICGASAGSTGGGIKVSRLIILFKSIKREVESVIRPRKVKTVMMDGKPVSETVIKNTFAYFAVYWFIAIGSMFLLVLIEGFNTEVTITAVMACLNNIGPGLDMVGPAGNFSMFSPLSKIILSLNMLIGRLEIWPMLLLFSPSVYKNTAGKHRIKAK